MAANLTPVNLSVADAHLAAGISIPDVDQMPTAPKVKDLDNWSQEAYSLDVSAATNLGFPVGNLSQGYRRQALMFGVSRWKDVTAQQHTYRFGVSLRAIIVVSDIKGGGSLTLPVISAKVEIEGARATAQLLVRGYKGDDLAQELPAWQSFGVDAYADYMKAISSIQATIMGTPANIEPELLATTVGATNLPSASASVGFVYALHAIAEGATLAHALDKLQSPDEEIARTVRLVYQARVGEGEKAAPDEAVKKASHDELGGLHLRRGWFGA